MLINSSKHPAFRDHMTTAHAPLFISSWPRSVCGVRSLCRIRQWRRWFHSVRPRTMRSSQKPRKKKTKTRGLQWWVCIWTPFSPTMSSPTSQAWHLLGTPCQGWDHPQDTSSSNLLHLHVTNYHRGLTTIVDRWHTVSRSNYACRSLCIVSWQPLISKIVIAFSTSALCHSTDSTLDSTTCQGILHE